jgi:hypothetical protein
MHFKELKPKNSPKYHWNKSLVFNLKSIDGNYIRWLVFRITRNWWRHEILYKTYEFKKKWNINITNIKNNFWMTGRKLCWFFDNCYLSDIGSVYIPGHIPRRSIFYIYSRIRSTFNGLFVGLYRCQYFSTKVFYKKNYCYWSRHSKRWNSAHNHFAFISVWGIST